MTQTRDDILAEVAGWISDGDFSDLRGMLSKRKRDREDSALRRATLEQERARLVSMIMGRMKNKMRDPMEFLKDVADGVAGNGRSGLDAHDLRIALLLADQGFLTVHVSSLIAGPWSNCIEVRSTWTAEITDAGRAKLKPPPIPPQPK